MTSRDRRALTAGAVVVGLALLCLRIAPAGWQRFQATANATQARSELLARMRDDVRSASRLEDSAVVIRRRMAALAPEVLVGETGSEAAADLGLRLSAAAERHRVRVNRTDQVADSAFGNGLARVTLRMALESDTQGLLGLLDATATETAVLVADELRIAVLDAHVSAERPELLQTELTVSGWYLTAKDTR